MAQITARKIFICSVGLQEDFVGQTGPLPAAGSALRPMTHSPSSRRPQSLPHQLRKHSQRNTSPAPVPHTCPVHRPPRKDRQRIHSPAALRLPGDRGLVCAVPGNSADRVDVSPESLPRTRLEKCLLCDRFQTGGWDEVGRKLF